MRIIRQVEGEGSWRGIRAGIRMSITIIEIEERLHTSYSVSNKTYPAESVSAAINPLDQIANEHASRKDAQVELFDPSQLITL